MRFLRNFKNFQEKLDIFLEILIFSRNFSPRKISSFQDFLCFFYLFHFQNYEIFKILFSLTNVESFLLAELTFAMPITGSKPLDDHDCLDYQTFGYMDVVDCWDMVQSSNFKKLGDPCDVYWELGFTSYNGNFLEARALTTNNIYIECVKYIDLQTTTTETTATTTTTTTKPSTETTKTSTEDPDSSDDCIVNLSLTISIAIVILFGIGEGVVIIQLVLRGKSCGIEVGEKMIFLIQMIYIQIRFDILKGNLLLRKKST